MTQTWLSVVGLIMEAVGILAAALGLWRSKFRYNGGFSESHWGWAGLAFAGLGLLVQLFDLAVRPLVWP